MNSKSMIVIVPLNVASYEKTDADAENNEYIRGYFKTIDKKRENDLWIKNRINIFINYTFRSLIKQTNQDFTACIIYDDRTEEIVNSEVKKYGKLPNNIIFISKSIADIFIKQKILGSEYVYFTRIDSDDMYHKEYIQKLYDHNIIPGTVALLNPWGYIYDSFNDKLAVYNAKVNSCYTLIYKTEDYLTGKVQSVITDQLDAQMGGVWSLPSGKEDIEGINHVWHMHSKNILSCFEEWFTNKWTNYTGDQINDINIIKEILDDFR